MRPGGKDIGANVLVLQRKLFFLPFIDIHTHKSRKEDGVLSLLNVDTAVAVELSETSSCSVGLHPWYIKPDGWQHQWAQLEQAATHGAVYAIGECGLDKAVDVDFDLQQKVFVRHITLANELGKPLILHCVRAFQEVQDALKQQQIMVPVIFHGFNRNLALAEQLMRAGYYLSFGEALLQANERLASVFAAVPDGQFFLETDNAECEILSIYAAAAAIRKRSVEDIRHIVEHNFHKVFHR